MDTNEKKKDENATNFNPKEGLFFKLYASFLPVKNVRILPVVMTSISVIEENKQRKTK